MVSSWEMKRSLAGEFLLGPVREWIAVMELHVGCLKFETDHSCHIANSS